MFKVKTVINYHRISTIGRPLAWIDASDECTMYNLYLFYRYY